MKIVTQGPECANAEQVKKSPRDAGGTEVQGRRSRSAESGAYLLFGRKGENRSLAALGSKAVNPTLLRQGLV